MIHTYPKHVVHLLKPALLFSLLFFGLAPPEPVHQDTGKCRRQDFTESSPGSFPFVQTSSLPTGTFLPQPKAHSLSNNEVKWNEHLSEPLCSRTQDEKQFSTIIMESFIKIKYLQGERTYSSVPRNEAHEPVGLTTITTPCILPPWHPKYHDICPLTLQLAPFSGISSHFKGLDKS